MTDLLNTELKDLWTIQQVMRGSDGLSMTGTEVHIAAESNDVADSLFAALENLQDDPAEQPAPDSQAEVADRQFSIHECHILNADMEASGNMGQLSVEVDRFGVRVSDAKAGSNVLVELTEEGLRCIIHPDDYGDSACGVTTNPRQTIIQDSNGNDFDDITIDHDNA